MAQKSFHNALRVPRASAVQLPLFLIPSCAIPQLYTQNRPPKSRNYANHAKTPDVRLVDPNASRKHLKPDFPMNTNPKTRDKSKKRGVSVIRSTGPKQAFRGKHMNYDLPVPVIDPERRKQFPTNPDHGLWGFFWENRSALTEPEDILKHGRSWTYQELSLKTFEELHAIYWVGHKDQNRLCTGNAEIARMHAGYGEYENEHRMNTVRSPARPVPWSLALAKFPGEFHPFTRRYDCLWAA